MSALVNNATIGNWMESVGHRVCAKLSAARGIVGTIEQVFLVDRVNFGLRRTVVEPLDEILIPLLRTTRD